MPAIFLAFGALLVNLARQYLPGIVGRVLVAFGIGLFTHQIAMPALGALLASKVSALPSIVAIYFYATGTDIVFTIILSALAARATQRILLKKLEAT